MRWNIPGGSRRNRWHRGRAENYFYEGTRIVAGLVVLGGIVFAMHLVVIGGGQ